MSTPIVLAGITTGLALALGLAAATLPFNVMVVGTAVAVLAPLLYRVAIPVSQPLAPWRLFLPILVGYNLLAIHLEEPRTAGEQVQMVVMFSVAFLVASTVVSLLTRPVEPPLEQPELVADGVLLWRIELAGFAVFGSLFARYGIPVLSATPAQTRVALANSAVILIVGQALLQLVIVIDVLRLARIVTIDHRARYLHLAAATAVLMATAGRSQILIPVAIAGVAMLISGWRRTLRIIMAGLVAFALFLAVGSFRSTATDDRPVLAPVRAYMVGTAQVTDRVIRTFDEREPYQGGRQMAWIPLKLVGEEVEPPGIYLRELSGRTLDGFGLEPGIIAALYLDFGPGGMLLGGAVVGGAAHLAYLAWRRSGGWWTIGYAYGLVWLLLAVTQHPIANYRYVLFPLLLAWWAHRNPQHEEAPVTSRW